MAGQEVFEGVVVVFVTLYAVRHLMRLAQPLNWRGRCATDIETAYRSAYRSGRACCPIYRFRSSRRRRRVSPL